MHTYPEAAPPDLTPPVSPSAMRAAVYEMPRCEAGMMLRNEDLAIVCRIGGDIFESELLGMDAFISRTYRRRRHLLAPILS